MRMNREGALRRTQCEKEYTVRGGVLRARVTTVRGGERDVTPSGCAG